MRTTHLLIAALLLLPTACSDEADPPAAADAAATTDTGTEHDAAMGDTSKLVDVPQAQDSAVQQDSTAAQDTNVAQDSATDVANDVAPDLPPRECDRTGFTVVEQVASGEAGFVEYIASDGTDAAASQLTVELLYDDIPQEDHSFVFFGENYKTCATCVTIRTNVGCEGEACDQKLFLVDRGRLDVTTWAVPGSGRFAGSLTDIEAIEVTLAGGMDFTTTPVEGGEVWCIESMAFDAELTHW